MAVKSSHNFRPTANRTRHLAAWAVLATASALFAGCARNDNYFGDHPSSRLSGPSPNAAIPPSAPAGAPRASAEPFGTYRGGRDPKTGLATGAPPWTRTQGSQVEALPPPTSQVAAAPSSMHAARGDAGNLITVQPGDTLYGLAKKHHVSISALMSINRLAEATIQPGQMLRLR